MVFSVHILCQVVVDAENADKDWTTLCGVQQQQAADGRSDNW